MPAKRNAACSARLPTIARRRSVSKLLIGTTQQHAESMVEFGGRLALQELHVVDQQQVDAPQPLLEAERRLALHGSDEMIHEVVGGEIDDVAARLGGAGGPGDGVEQMRF